MNLSINLYMMRIKPCFRPRNFGHFCPFENLFFFLGRLHGGKILTIDVLMRGGWSTTTNKCNFCKISEESTNLTLMHSDRTRKMWESLLAILAAIVGISRFCERGARHGQKMEDIVGDWMV